LSPAKVIDLAVDARLKAIALTDHDTVGGIDEAMKRAIHYKNKGIDFTFIPGVELSVGYKKRDIHILGLYIDSGSQNLRSLLKQMVDEREERNLKMVQNFQNDGIQITMEELKEESKDAVITRAHFAKILVRKQYVKTAKEAFDRYLNEDSKYYVNRKFITPEQAIEAILDADGIPVLAHPMLYHLPEEELDQLVERLTKHGLKGIETIYSTYSPEEEETVRQLADKYHLLMTGGSDFHGEVKPDISIGTGRGNLVIPDELLDGLKQIRA
jgi:hypothetical protein